MDVLKKWLRTGTVAVLCCGGSVFAKESAMSSFSTGGYTVYNLRTGVIEPGGETVLIAAAFDGAVLCFFRDGKLIWKNEQNQAMPYDLDIADLDGDGRDETLLASADGTLYVFDHQGALRWKFSREPPLLQVCVVKKPDGTAVVLTGGIERKLYALSPQGKVLHTREFDSVIRHIRAGNILGDGKEYASVLFAKNANAGLSLQLFDPNRLEPVWKEPVELFQSEDAHKKKGARNLTILSMLICDLDGDGREEIVLSEAAPQKGLFRAYNHRGELVMESSTSTKFTGAYRMNLLEPIRIGKQQDARIAGLFGNQLVLYRLDGAIENILTAPYAPVCHTFDPASQTLYFGSSTTGGDGVYALRLDLPGWETAFEKMKPEAKLARIEQNIELLNRQIEQFEFPAYQRPPRKTQVVTKNILDLKMIDGQADIEATFLKDWNYQNVTFVPFYTRTENFDRSVLKGIWKTKKDIRHPYKFSADDLVAFAAAREAKKEPFALWAGHGTGPFYIQLATLEKMLAAAPTMLKTLVFAEMERMDDDMAYAVREHLLPLAELCRKQGTTKIVLRNKNIFWNANCYEDFWREALLIGEYRDVFIPSMEETNDRTQEITLSGRMGLWLTGKFDHISSRAVTDAANFTRFWEWCAQQKQTHHVRMMALHASLGADLFLVNIYQGDERDVAPFYRMVDKGIIAIPERDELLSVSEVCLGMQQPAESFLKHGNNGHRQFEYEPGGEPAVFDRLDCYWGGAPTTPVDFSTYAMGSRFRRLNFMPVNPYGLIATVPADTDLSKTGMFKTMIRTDGEVFYDEKGKAISAADYKETAEALVKAAALKLPIRVEGDVAWSVVRLDPTHVRVVLIDSGYSDPADRDARIVLQHLNAIECRDILSGEILPVTDGTVSLTVPAAILRIVDVDHQ
jgi:hypothetical protein